MTHVCLHHRQPIVANQLIHQVDPLLIGCHLSTQVREVVVETARAATARDLPRGHQDLGDLCKRGGGREIKGTAELRIPSSKINQGPALFSHLVIKKN